MSKETPKQIPCPHCGEDVSQFVLDQDVDYGVSKETAREVAEWLIVGIKWNGQCPETVADESWLLEKVDELAPQLREEILLWEIFSMVDNKQRDARRTQRDKDAIFRFVSKVEERADRFRGAYRVAMKHVQEHWGEVTGDET